MTLFKQFKTEEILNLIPDPILMIDTYGTILFFNQSFSNLLGYSYDELYHQNIINFLVDDSIFQECLLQLQATNSCTQQTTLFIAKNQQHIVTTKNVSLITIDSQEYALVSLRDISQIEQINQELKYSKEILEAKSKHMTRMLLEHKQEIAKQQIQLDEIINSIDEIIWYINDKNMQIQYVSNAIEKIFQEKKESFLYQSSLWMDMIYDADKQKVMDAFAQLQAHESTTIEFRIKLSNGDIKWLSNTIKHHPSLEFFIGVTHDITKQKEDQDKIEFMAYHDALTGLPNRSYLKKNVELMLKKSQIVQQNFAILFLDLDNFKFINDSLGHDIGDKLLIKISQRLQDATKKYGECVRFGGDEFIIIINNTNNEKNIRIITSELISTISKSITIQEREFFISCSIGIAMYPEDTNSFTGLIKAADTAMYTAKISGKNRYEFYENSMDADMGRFFKIEHIIKDALNHNYFHLYFQPLIVTDTLTLCGFEALLRLNHPEFGFVSPEEFIPVAEASGDIIKISDFVISMACSFAKEVNKKSKQDLTVSINISARQFKEKNFAQNFLKYLKSHEIKPHLIKIEIVESAVMENTDLTIKTLKLLRQDGIKISLDDFGTGYSSFAYLAQLPLDTIKIDKSFVLQMLKDETNQHIVKAITSLAHHLGKDVVAEGVETLEHIQLLQLDKVDILQGFYFHKALPPEEILDNFDNLKQIFHMKNH